jgi:outer membrane protein
MLLRVSRAGADTLSHAPGLDVGGDYNLDKRWFVNGDIKYIKPLQSDVSAGGTKVSTVNLDPFLFSLGVGYHF